jgi:tetratricopeptide (TPR) repeat protein
LDQSLRLDPSHAETLRLRANVLQNLGRLDEAVEACRQAIALRPRYGEAFHDQGVALRALRRYEDALSCFDHALALSPGYADAHVNRGVVLTDLNRHDEALASYDDAIRCDPGHAGAFSNRGSLLCVLKRFDEALESLDRGLRFDPDNADCLNNRGGVLANLGRLDEALATYEKIIRLAPGHAAAHNNKGAMLTELGNLPEALESFETAIALAPRTVRFYFNAAENRTFAAGDRHMTALEAMAQTMAELGVDEQINLHFTLGKAYRDIGDKTRFFHHLVQGNALKFNQSRYCETARLQTFERLRDAFPARLAQATTSRNEPGPTPVFIVGMPRSGSTLIEQILASHPAVFAAGEVNYFDAVLFDVSPDGDASSPEALAAIPPETWREAGARHVRRLRTMAPNASCLTNKKLMNFMVAGMIHLALPQARIIHARRHPVDTCLSCFSKNFTDDLAFTYDLGALGRYYRGYEKLMDHWRGVLPAGVMLDVQYEDVVADLEGQARQILRHCGLEWDPRCLDFHKTQRPVRTASRVQVRQPLFASSVGRWKDYEAELAPLLAELDRES